MASLLGLPTVIRQEDGSRDEMEQLFQTMDSDMSRTVNKKEFVRFFAQHHYTASAEAECTILHHEVERLERERSRARAAHDHLLAKARNELDRELAEVRAAVRRAEDAANIRQRPVPCPRLMQEA